MKFKFVKINEPTTDYSAQVLGPDYIFKNIALVDASGTIALAEVNALALKEGLLNSPELLKLWGLELRHIAPISDSKKTVKKVEPKISE